MTSTRTLEGRIALVTGASRGIGRAVALALSAQGAHVIALARVIGALEDLFDEIKALGGTCTLVKLDLKSGKDIDALGPSLAQRWDKLDIFIGNGGMLGPLSPLPHILNEDWDQTVAVNLTANWRLIRTLDPLLRQSDAGRAIFVTSGAASGKYAYWGPYAVTKAGVEALAKTYANEVENSPVNVNIVNPGPVATAMRAQAFPGEDASTLPSPDDIAPLFVDLSSPSCTSNGEIFDAKAWLGSRAK